MRSTALMAAHQAAGARLVAFAGWQMPIHYGSQIEEHHAVRREAGMFDVSHMTVVDIEGADAKAYLDHLLANDIGRLQHDGQALYGCMLNEAGGIIDDLITYRIAEDFYRTVVNAATRDTDLAWMQAQAHGFQVTLTERPDLAMLAVQGPTARATTMAVLSAPGLDSLKPFHASSHGDVFVARTGYTGEDGFELLLPADQAEALWNTLMASGVRPCGLGARDSLRLEAGLNLYGQDMTTRDSPLVSNLAWTVAFEDAAGQARQFVGAEALRREQAAGPSQQLVGLILGKGAIPRTGTVVQTVSGEGVVTSGSFSPSIERPIALARLPAAVQGEVQVLLRGREWPAQVVRPPFVRQGQIKVAVPE